MDFYSLKKEILPVNKNIDVTEFLYLLSFIYLKARDKPSSILVPPLA
jgi:hypothetical protein